MQSYRGWHLRFEISMIQWKTEKRKHESARNHTEANSKQSSHPRATDSVSVTPMDV